MKKFSQINEMCKLKACNFTAIHVALKVFIHQILVLIIWMKVWKVIPIHKCFTDVSCIVSKPSRIYCRTFFFSLIWVTNVQLLRLCIVVESYNSNYSYLYKVHSIYKLKQQQYINIMNYLNWLIILTLKTF